MPAVNLITHSDQGEELPQDLSMKGRRNSNLEASIDARNGLSLLVAALNAEQNSKNVEHSVCSSQSDASCSSPALSTESRKRKGDNNEDIIVDDGGKRTRKDDAYWEKRRRNNEAAKRSREKRRQNDMVLEQKLQELADENERLKRRVQTDGDETPSVVMEQQQQQHLPPAQPPIATTCQQPADTSTPTSSLLANMMPLLAGSLKQPPLNLLQGPAINYANPLQPPPPQTQASPLLQLYTAAQLQAAMQRPPPPAINPAIMPPLLPSSVGGGAFRPVIPQCQRVSPDSTVNHHQVSTNIDMPLLGSILTGSTIQPSSQALSPANTTTTGVKLEPEEATSLKHCLSSLAVQLQTKAERQSIIMDGVHSPTTTGSSTAEMGGGRVKSESPGHSDGSQQISPASSGVSGVSPHSPTEHDDDEGEPMLVNGSRQYLERRRRNNEAAKRCRANRRALYEFRFRRAQQLEGENVRLKEEVGQLKLNLEALRQIILQQTSENRNNSSLSNISVD